MLNENCIHSLSLKFIIYIYVFFANKIEFKRRRRRRCKRHKYKKKVFYSFHWHMMKRFFLGCHLNWHQHIFNEISIIVLQYRIHGSCILHWRLSCFQLNSTLANWTFFAAVISRIPSFCVWSAHSKLSIDNNWWFSW